MDAAVKQLADNHLGKGMLHQVYAELNLLRTVVPESEPIQNLFIAKVEPFGKGVLILTDHRLVFFKMKRLNQQTIELPLADVSQIETRKRLAGFDVTVAGAGVFLEAKEIFHPRRVAELESYVRSYRTGSASASGPPVDNPGDTLRNLAALRDDGILSEEEFQAKKTELLARM